MMVAGAGPGGNTADVTTGKRIDDDAQLAVVRFQFDGMLPGKCRRILVRNRPALILTTLASEHPLCLSGIGGVVGVAIFSKVFEVGGFVNPVFHNKACHRSTCFLGKEAQNLIGALVVVLEHWRDQFARQDIGIHSFEVFV